MQLDLIGGRSSLDFANNHARAGYAGDYGGVLAVAEALGLLDGAQISRLRRAAERRPAERDQVCERADGLARALRRLFGALADRAPVPSRALGVVNREVGAALAHAQVNATGEGYEWGWAAGRPLDLDRPLWPIARDAADLLVSVETDRLRCCAAESCRWLFVDYSKSGRRRWCDMRTCGNRAKAQRFRDRHG